MPSRKVVPLPIGGLAAPDAIEEWAGRYLDATVRGVRSAEVADKIALHLPRFRDHFHAAHGHDRLSTVVRREVLAWRRHLAADRSAGGLGLAPATVNTRLASLSGFTTWVCAHDPAALPHGNPCAKVGDLPLPALEPRTLTPGQVRTLRNVLDRLPRFHQHKGRRRSSIGECHGHARPLRDRAIVHTLRSRQGRHQPQHVPVRRRPHRPGRLPRTPAPGRRRRDLDRAVPVRRLDQLPPPRWGLSPRSINLICEQIGRWHDAEHPDPARHISPLRPHDLRHSFAFALAEATGNDAYELQRRLGHQSQRYINRYTDPPEDIAAGYIEQM